MKQICCGICAVLIANLWIPYQVSAATNSSIRFTGIEVGDQVEIYRIADYTEGTFSWETKVSDWIINDTEGKTYAELTPSLLAKMTEDRAIEFCQSFLVSCKNESTGIANLQGYSFTAEEEKEQYMVENVTPGYYLVLPKGKTRIYEIKWIVVNPESSVDVNYDEAAGDYQLPKIEATVVNNTSADHATALEGDELGVSATIAVPQYPNMYATGKRILNVSVVVPDGLEYVEDSISVESGGELEYSKGDYKKAIGYQNKDGKLLFFETSEGFYYELSGEQLLATGSTEDAITAYNTKHKTTYELPQEETDKKQDSETDSTENDRTETTETQSTESQTTDVTTTETTASETVSEENTESVVNGEVVTNLGKSENKNEIKVLNNLRIFILSVDTEKELSQIALNYKVTKDNRMNDTGFLDNEIVLSYSVSPLDANLIYNSVSIARVQSYGFQIVVCEGNGESVNMTVEEKYTNATRLTGAEFALYKLNNIYEGNYIEENNLQENTQTNTESSETTKDTAQTENTEQTEDTAQTENTESVEPQTLEYYYDKAVDKTYEYVYVKKIAVNAKGEVSIGGLEATGYLITQTAYPVGHALSESSLVIAPTTWTDEQAMESNCLFRILWLDYETVYLPGTGSSGARDCYIFGLVIMLCAAGFYLDYNKINLFRRAKQRIRYTRKNKKKRK